MVRGFPARVLDEVVDGALHAAHTQRKELIRAVITEIVLTPGNPDERDSGRTCQIRIIWQGSGGRRPFPRITASAMPTARAATGLTTGPW